MAIASVLYFHEREVDMIVLLVVVVILTAGDASAQSLQISGQTGPDFEYDPATQYVEVTLSDFATPDFSDNSNILAKFLKSVFLKRKHFGIAFVEVTNPLGKKEKTIVFQYEREDNDKYTYKYIGATGNLTYPIALPFVMDAPVGIRIVTRNWQAKESRAAIKQIIGAIDQSGVGVATGHSQLLLNATQILGLVEKIFQPDDRTDALILRLAPKDLLKTNLTIQARTEDGEMADFFSVQVASRSGFFEGYDLDLGLRHAPVGDLSSWKEVIQTADGNIETDGIGPLNAVIRSFADVVASSELTRRDKAILTACGVRSWAPKATGGVTVEGNVLRFTAHHYSRLPTGDLQAVRGSVCDFGGVDCGTPHCHAVSDFINKSATASGRVAAAALYLDGELTATVDGVDTTLQIDSFRSDFRIRRPAFFDIVSNGPDSWTFEFERNTLDLSLGQTRYKSRRIGIDLIRRKSAGARDRFIVTGIEISGSA